MLPIKLLMSITIDRHEQLGLNITKIGYFDHVDHVAHVAHLKLRFGIWAGLFSGH